MSAVRALSSFTPHEYFVSWYSHQGSMTPRERIRTAMAGGTPDRVPLMCQMSIGHMLLQLQVRPSEFWHDADCFADGLVRLREQYAFDGILVSLHGHDPDWRSGIAGSEMKDGVETITWKTGGRTTYLTDDLPMHDAGVPRQQRDPAEPIPTVITYIPVSGGLHFALRQDHLFDIFGKIRQRCGPDISIHGEVTSAFDYFLDWFGYEDGLMFLLDDPPRAAEILGTFANGVAVLAEAMCKEDIDAIKISSPFAGAGFLSRDQYREYVMPYETRLIEGIHRGGKAAYIHTCGAIGDRLDLMRDTGADGLECLDPPPMGTVDLAGALEELHGSLFVKGNVDSVSSLLLGTPEAIERDGRARLELGKSYRRFILSTACSIAPHVPADHIKVLTNLVSERGRYDRP